LLKVIELKKKEMLKGIEPALVPEPEQEPHGIEMGYRCCLKYKL
jgi:hypothetical protein